jgi:hypothetical protein
MRSFSTTTEPLDLGQHPLVPIRAHLVMETGHHGLYPGKPSLIRFLQSFRGRITAAAEDTIMIEFRSYVRNLLAPRILVDNLGGIYRLDGGINQATFVQQSRAPHLQCRRASQPHLARSTLARIWRHVARGVAGSHSRNVRWRRAATQISLTRVRLPLS